MQMGTKKAIFMKLRERVIEMIWLEHSKNGTPQTIGGASDNRPRKFKWLYQNSETAGGIGL